jgi:hypothetical protein
MENFFASSGLTSTEANHIANIAQESVKNIITELSSVKFFDVFISGIGSGVEQKVSSGKIVNDINGKLKIIGEMNSLCAWLREAIKAKDKMIQDLEQTDTMRFCVKNGIEYPEYPDAPDYGHTPVIEDVYNAMPAKWRANYYFYESNAAAYGKYIHPDGSFSKARQALLNAISNPITVSGSGRDTVVYSNKPIESATVVDQQFIDLQKEYRNYEKQLNLMKAQLKDKLSDEISKYCDEVDRLKSEYTEALNNYTTRVRELTTECIRWKTEERTRISNLRIFIPELLQDAYNYVVSLTK